MQATEIAAPSRGVFTALSSRDFRLLFAGQTVSIVGDAAFLVALGWRTFQLTGSAGSLGFVLMVESAAMLVTVLIGGVLADRHERRLLMIGSDLARLCVVAPLAALDAVGHLTFHELLAFAFAMGLGTGFFQPAFGGIVPLVVEPANLPSANALIGVTRQGAFMVGPALAGPLYGAFGSAAVFGVNAASFLVSAIALALARPRRIEPSPREGMRREMLDGVRYVFTIPWLWVTIAIFSFVLMVGFAPFQVLLPKLVEEHFGLGVNAYSLLFTMQGAGMAAGAIIYGHVPARRRRAAILYGFFAVNCLLTVLVALSPWYPLAAIVSVFRGALIGYGIALWGTTLMTFVPEERLSRVVSVDWFGSLGLLPVGYALAAVVSGLAAPGTLIAAGSLASAALFIAGFSVRGVRDID